MGKLRVTDFMDDDPVAAHPEMSLVDLVELFGREHVRALPVTDGEGRLVGVVTERDVFLKRKGVGFSLEKVPTLLGQPVPKDQLEDLEIATHVTVGEVMTPRPVTVDSDATLEEAAMLMLDRQFAVLPVVDGERLIGIVRRHFILNRIYRRRD